MKEPARPRVKKLLDWEFRKMGGKNKYVEAVEFEDQSMVIQYDHTSGPQHKSDMPLRSRYLLIVGPDDHVYGSFVVASWWVTNV
jgi:hypothetical protein